MSELLPAERIALTVARAAVDRGEPPGINVATVLVMALERLSTLQPPVPEDFSPSPCACERWCGDVSEEDDRNRRAVCKSLPRRRGI